MSLMLFSTEVRQRYTQIHGYSPLLTNIDLVYSVHGLVLTTVAISQLFCWGFKKRTTSLRKMTKLIILCVLSAIAVLYSVVGTNKLHALKDQASNEVFSLLDLAIVLSYIKIFMSLIKYIPQLLHNHKRRSVLGFSMFTIFLDCSGGILSVAQLFLDAYITTGHLNMEILISNGGKLWLSFVTLFFDCCFIYQWLNFEKLASKEKTQYTQLP
jgi:cystinosin